MLRTEIVKTLKQTETDHRRILEQTADEAVKFGQHADWPWNGMILSAATRGGSKRADLIMPRYQSEFAWAAIERVGQADRHQRFASVGRFKNKTADWLDGVFEHIRASGGPASLRTTLSVMPARDVIAFWCAFPGMGDKYARNIMMDTYDPRFRKGFFAIDSRIEALLKTLGYSGPPKYAAQEKFLNELAAEVQVDSWDLDRLLYQRSADLKKLLSAS